MALLTILVVATLLRCAYLGREIRYDEARTYLRTARHSLWHVTTRYESPNNHVLHSVLVHFSTRLFGNSPYAIRLPALLAGIGVVWVTYQLGRVYFGSNAALLAAGLAAGWLPLVDYSVNARGYSLQALLVGLVFVNIERICRGVSGRTPFITGLLLAFALWTIPTGSFAVLAALLQVLLRCGRRLRDWRLLGDIGTLFGSGAVASLVLYGPILLRPGNALLSNRWVAPLSASEFWSGFPEYPRQIWGWINGEPSRTMEWIILGCLVASCLGLARVRVRRGLLVCVCLLVAGLVLMMARRMLPF